MILQCAPKEVCMLYYTHTHYIVAIRGSCFARCDETTRASIDNAIYTYVLAADQQFYYIYVYMQMQCTIEINAIWSDRHFRS